MIDSSMMDNNDKNPVNNIQFKQFSDENNKWKWAYPLQMKSAGAESAKIMYYSHQKQEYYWLKVEFL